MVEKDYFDDKTGTPKAAAAEAEALGVDARLDNRRGSDRAPIGQDPAVPQQVDGPDLMHQEEHAAAVAKLAEKADAVERVGMFSAGDHSLGDPSARGGNDAGQADTVLETDPASDSSASTSLRTAAPEAVTGMAAVTRTETATAGPGEHRSRTAPAAKETSAKDAKEGIK